VSVQHIAIIMDGNGRWAKERGLKRVRGHEKGAEVVRAITTHCAKQGISHLTLYAFSTENWKRPKSEVTFLMKLLERYLKEELATYEANNIRFDTIGDLSPFSPALQKRIAITKEKTAHHTALTQVLALNYGGRDEICRAMNSLRDYEGEITESIISEHLDTAAMPEVDMLIRTSGEERLSNFLLWQAAYAEFFFTSTLWPDFTAEELEQMITNFKDRERRFGGV